MTVANTCTVESRQSKMVCLLIGLSASTVRWLTKLYDSGKYLYSGVKAVKDVMFINWFISLHSEMVN